MKKKCLILGFSIIALCMFSVFSQDNAPAAETAASELSENENAQENTKG